MTEEQSRKNREFGRGIAELMWEEGMKKCPFILNLEQANALEERWEELRKQKKAMQQKTMNFFSKKKNKRKYGRYSKK